MENQFMKLSRTMAYALRHHPEKFGLILDEEGWVSLSEHEKNNDLPPVTPSKPPQQT